MHIQPIAGTQDAYVSPVGQDYVESPHVIIRALNDLEFGCFILVMPEADPVRLSRPMLIAVSPIKLLPSMSLSRRSPVIKALAK
jgi:hypothetical protein